ncbi:SMP-30/gluconolaconase/LRE-like protein [Kribbella voronezhensis]|uniref:SMP-30/gluconolaconase/LRE-like protein n=1 Tax=Kribbella voronezhensis TaxID=2512212 RepID=A0A4R7SUT4_9ACTN|nr:SMP-30/gluconolactonase/LRE family protein [Kribbella voronezhensis]TDU82316.1 SMP-30/gluconolaconase/LRE-like protein [Kribbella voronezhensis]
MFRRTAAVVALLTFATAAPVSVVPASAVRVDASRGWPVAISGQTADRYPEGVTWDPSRQAFLVGSLATGRIDVVDRRGRSTRLVDEAPGVSTFGLHVDAARNRLLVTYADIGNGEQSSEATTYQQSGVAIYNLRTGRLQHRVDLNTPALNPAGGRHGVNDLAVDGRGNAYVTDPAADAIYRITPQGKASVLVRDARLASRTIGMNGIVWDPAGYLLAVRYDVGALLKISPAGAITEVKLPKALIGGDGLALTADRKLVAVTNKLGAPGVEEVTVLRSTDNYRSARVVAAKAWPISGPTTVALSPHGMYVVSGRIDVLVAGGQSNEFDLYRF